jgi:hypothetical protein
MVPVAVGAAENAMEEESAWLCCGKIEVLAVLVGVVLVVVGLN